MHYDYIIIGGGIVGLSTALQLQQRYPDHKILLLEKEDALARHQTGHNSGVIHSGIYYPPGSFKARFCRAGAAATVAYCEQRGIALRRPGKLIVACDQHELLRLEKLYTLSKSHGLATAWLSAGELNEQEPHIRGLAAILVDSTGIVDYREIVRQLARDFAALGGRIELNQEVISLAETRDAVQVRTARDEFATRFLLACGGLQSDRLARMLDLAVDFRIIPVRGEYYRLPEHRRDLVRRLIYPVPAPDMPFLGVHITPMIDGTITVGPNAVFAWRREAYDDIGKERPGRSVRDAVDSVTFSGFWRMGGKYWRFALGEAINSLSKRGYLKSVHKYCPELGVEDLQAYPAGVRAQAVTRDGSLVHDFLFAESPRTLHVCNAPSPAATSALPIGAHLCDKLAASGRY
ncbi:L-2-hydroxyglutarate oxidase [Proteobacteria bacterium 005FR1]|nr:L-2-hydroxyglutarate oxidase [Proteobacteria bacterium 005FR1]